MLATEFQPKHARQSRLLGQTDTPLTLLVRGGEHDGRVIRLSSAKCTIGSARGCTLRLRAAGIRPLHCWILRSPHATLLRSWSADVQLNGAAVRDAYLRTGDRLRIGPVEFEIVATTNTTAPAQRTDTDVFNQHAAAPLAAHEPSLQQLQLMEECRRLNADLQAAREALRHREADLEKLRSSGPAQTEQDGEALELLRSERDQVHAELAAANHYWQLERASLVNRLSEVTALVGEQPRQADEDRRAALEEAKQAAERLVQANADLQRLRTEMQRERDKFHEVRVTLERDLSAAQAIADEREENIELVRSESIAQTAQLTQLLGELRHEMVCQQAEQQREWESLNTTRTRLERENASLLQRLHESETRRGDGQRSTAVPTDHDTAAPQEELQNQISSLERQRAQLEQDLAARAEQIDQLTTELRQLREQLSIATSELQEARQQVAGGPSTTQEEQLALDELREALTREQDQLAAAQQEFAAERAAAAKDQQELQAELRERQVELNRRAQSVAEQFAELREQQIELDQQAAELEERRTALAKSHLQPEAVSSPEEPNQPVDDATRLDEQSYPCADSPRSPSTEIEDEQVAVVSSAIESTSAPSAEGATAEQPAPVEATEPDESIESYMSRLLQRVRGEGGDKLSAMMPKQKPAAVAQAAPSEQPEDVAQKQIVAMIEPVKESEYVPRSQAPEQTVSLAAMRELANSAARTAISTHASKRKNLKAASTLLGGILSLAASCLLGYWAYRSGSLVAMVGTLVGLLIAGYWCARSTRECLSLWCKRPPNAGTQG